MSGQKIVESKTYLVFTIYADRDKLRRTETINMKIFTEDQIDVMKSYIDNKNCEYEYFNEEQEYCGFYKLIECHEICNNKTRMVDHDRITANAYRYNEDSDNENDI
jgi:hypothetical protein